MAEGVLAKGFNGLAQPMPTLPRDWYRDPAHHDREIRAIWRDAWLYGCRAADLSATGDYRVLDLAGQSVIVLRDREGGIRAFHNVCRHRGSVLCTETQGHLERPMLVCPYHQWSYALDGRLLATGHMRKVEGFAREGHGLFPVATAEWKGMIFLNLSPEPSDFAGHAPDLSPLGNWPLGDLVTGHRMRTEIACNWKVFWENFNECLHCPDVHPELCQLVPIYGRAIMARKDDPDWEATSDDPAPHRAGTLREGAMSWSMDGRAGPPLPGLSAADRAAGQSYAVVLPSVFVVGHIDYARIVRLMPLGPERTELTAEWLFPAETLADPAFDRANVTDFATLVMDQDARACELNQAGLGAGPFASGTLMQEEYEVFLFQDWVRGRLGEPQLGAGGAPRASRRKKD